MMTGAIELFGGLGAFLDRYTWVDKWGNRVGIRRKTAEINAVLDESVWIRRTQKAVLPNLPPKNRDFVTWKYH
jgi:hypothetical protein